MADRFVFFRFMAKKAAQSLGALATFMPKPFSEDFRSGAHFNMSLADRETGANLFTPGSGQDRALAETHGAAMSDLALSPGRRSCRSGATTTARPCCACP
jgi:glutamine synthetase